MEADRLDYAVIRIANPIYDGVFKALMQDLETARGILSVILGIEIVSLRFGSQEYSDKPTDAEKRVVLRIDFYAVIQTDDGRQFQVIIELQKAKLAGDILRFRHYLASRYQTIEEIQVDGRTKAEPLPIISIYMLGFALDDRLPMATHIRREYCNAVTGQALDNPARPNFIERLTHDCYVVQIPKIASRMGTALERILSVFDQHRIVGSDRHRLEFDDEVVKSDPLLARIVRTLNRLQEDPDMEKLLTLEDVFLLEQERMVDARTEELESKLAEQHRLREEEQRRREEEQRRREEEQRRRKAAEAEVEALRRRLGLEEPGSN